MSKKWTGMATECEERGKLAFSQAFVEFSLTSKQPKVKNCNKVNILATILLFKQEIYKLDLSFDCHPK